MSLYTKLDLKNIQTILQQYNIGELSTYKTLVGGAENTNTLITTRKGKYVLTLCERKTLEETTVLANLLNHLEEYQYPSSILVRNNSGSTVSTFQKKPILLKKYIDGYVEEMPSSDIIKEIGRSIGQLHLLPVPPFLPTQFSYGQQIFFEVTQSNLNLPFVDWLAKKHKFILENCSGDLPKALLHGDVFSSNVVISPTQQPVIMDFEEACHYYRLFDVGMAIVGLCRENGKLIWEKAQELLVGYIEVVPLTPLEKQKVQAFIIYAATATAFWRFRQFNILVPTKSMQDNYLEMQDIANQAMMESPLRII